MGSGTLRGFTINGISYRVTGSANLDNKVNSYENKMLPTTGEPMYQKMKRIPSVESLSLTVDWAEAVVLKQLADSSDLHKFSITMAGGEKCKCQGCFNINSYKSEDNAMEITIEPSGEWTVFV